MSTKEKKIKKPHIVVGYIDNMAVKEVMKEVEAGIEEEGIPWITKEFLEDDLVKIAYHCAQAAPLGVGVMIGKDKSITIHVNRLPEAKPLFYLPGPEGNKDLWRKYGANAARIIKTIPFKNLEDSDNNSTCDKFESLIAKVTAEVIKVLTETGLNLRR